MEKYTITHKNTSRLRHENALQPSMDGVSGASRSQVVDLRQMKLKVSAKPQIRHATPVFHGPRASHAPQHSIASSHNTQPTQQKTQKTTSPLSTTQHRIQSVPTLTTKQHPASPKKSQLKANEYFITVSDIGRFIKKIFLALWRSTWLDRVGFILLITFVVGLKKYTALAPDDIALWVLTFCLFFWNLDAKSPIILALIGLILIPFLLWLGSNWFIYGTEWAELVAVWVYLLLVIGVAKHIWDFMREKNHAY